MSQNPRFILSKPYEFSGENLSASNIWELDEMLHQLYESNRLLLQLLEDQNLITVDEEFGVAEVGSAVTASGSGDVVGPASSTDGDIALFDGTTGKLLQDGGKLGSNLVTGPASATSGDIATFSGTSGKIIADGSKLATDLVTGPASVTADANIAVYNGTTGKIIKDSGTLLSSLLLTSSFNAATVNISEAELEAFDGTAGTAKTVVAAPGSGKVVLLIKPFVQWNIVTAYGNNPNTLYRYAGSTTDIWTAQVSSLNSGSGTTRLLANIDNTYNIISSTFDVEDKALTFNLSAALTGAGEATGKVTFIYATVDAI